MIIGTAETEGTYFVNQDLLVMDDAAMQSKLRERLGAVPTK